MPAVKSFLTIIISITLCFFVAMNNYSSAKVSQDEQDIAINSAQSMDKAVKDTSEVIDKAETVLDNARTIIKKMRQDGRITKEKNAELLQGIAEAEYALDVSKGPLKNYSKYSDKVGKTIELYVELKNIQDTYNSNNTYLGQTGGALAILSTLGKKFGDKIPVPGMSDIIKGYADVTGKLLENTVQVSKDIQKYQNQNVIGGESYKAGADREKQEIFQRDFPKQSKDLYMPTTPYYVYEAVEGSKVRFIWDEDAKKFYPVPPNVPVTMIHRYNLLLDRNIDPQKLKAFVDKWQDLGSPRYQASNQLADLFNGFQDKNIPFAQKNAILNIRSKYFDQLRLTNSDRDLFLAKYIFDKTFKDQVDKSLTDLYAVAANDPQLKSFADYLYKLAQQNNVYIAYVQPINERQNIKKPATKIIAKDTKLVQKPYQPKPEVKKITVQNNNNQYKPVVTPKPEVKKPVPAVNEQQRGQAICSAYMSSLSKHYADTAEAEDYYRIEFTPPFTYKSGSCYGGYNLWRKKPGVKEYVEVIYGPTSIAPSALESSWKSKYPGAGWPK